MKKTFLSLSLLLTIGASHSFAQTSAPQPPMTAMTGQEKSQAQSLDVSPKEAIINVSYKMEGGKMLVFIKDNGAKHVFVETTESTLSEDTYKIYSADGKRLIATYTAGRKATDIKLMIENPKNSKAFVLGEYLARATSDLEKDAMKRKIPVYWLYKNGYAK